MKSSKSKTKYGFTLIELLVALTVMGIILASVTTLAYTVGNASDIAGDNSRDQSQLRYAMLRFSELIRNSLLVFPGSTGDLAVWRNDDNGNSQIEITELVYIERGIERNYLRLLEFYSPSSNPYIDPDHIQNGNIKVWADAQCQQRYTYLITDCNNVQLGIDVMPPDTKLISVSFWLNENEVLRPYQLVAALRCWAGNLVEGSMPGTIDIVSDDD